MQRLYWLASYPRSGNTWLRYLIANAFLGTFEQPADVARAVPDADAGRVVVRELSDPVAFVKTHQQYRSDLYGGIEAAGVVYLVRHPVDVLQSVLRYAVMMGFLQPDRQHPQTHDETVRDWVRRYLEQDGWPRGVEAGFGSWRTNVASWAIDPLPCPRLVLRYEDIVADTPAALRQIATLVGSAITDARIRQAIGISSAERLMALEAAQTPDSKSALFAGAAVARKRSLGLQFIRSFDAPGAASLALTPAEVAATREKFADLMARFGYS